MNTYGALNQKLVYQSLTNKELAVLPDGMNGAWLVNDNGKYICDEDYNFGFELLENFSFICEEMLSKSLCVSFKKNRFVAELSIVTRNGGYEEPLQNVVVCRGNGSSIYEALKDMDDKIRRKRENNLDGDKPKLSLIKD